MKTFMIGLLVMGSISAFASYTVHQGQNPKEYTLTLKDMNQSKTIAFSINTDESSSDYNMNVQLNGVTCSVDASAYSRTGFIAVAIKTSDMWAEGFALIQDGVVFYKNDAVFSLTLNNYYCVVHEKK